MVEHRYGSILSTRLIPFCRLLLGDCISGVCVCDNPKATTWVSCRQQHGCHVVNVMCTTTAFVLELATK